MCVKWMMSCTLRSDIIWLSPKLKSGLQYCLCALMAVTLESFLQFYFFLLPRCYSAMRVKAWNYKLQIALQNLKSVLPYINNTEYRSKVDVRLNGSSDSSLILVYCYFDRFFERRHYGSTISCMLGILFYKRKMIIFLVFIVYCHWKLNIRDLEH